MESKKTWSDLLASVKQTDFFKRAYLFSVADRKAGKRIYPTHDKVFNAFVLTPLDQTKVVILGQDPYHGPGQAEGLAFSVPDGIVVPPSLQNIFKELHNEFFQDQGNSPFLDRIKNKQGNLESWAKQGVLLLNAVLTVEEGLASSHAGRGWEQFTDAVIKKLSEEKEGLVFMLWGNYAKQKSAFIDQSKHTVLTAAHPSPLSAHNGFFGCGHFLKTNEILKNNGKQEIVW